MVEYSTDQNLYQSYVLVTSSYRHASALLTFMRTATFNVLCKYELLEQHM
jgi:hypothetical protein